VYSTDVLPNETVNITNFLWVGPDDNPYQYFSCDVNGKRWNSSDGLSALRNLIEGGSNSNSGSGFDPSLGVVYNYTQIF